MEQGDRVKSGGPRYSDVQVQRAESQLLHLDGRIDYWLGRCLNEGWAVGKVEYLARNPIWVRQSISPLYRELSRRPLAPLVGVLRAAAPLGLFDNLGDSLGRWPDDVPYDLLAKYIPSDEYRTMLAFLSGGRNSLLYRPELIRQFLGSNRGLDRVIEVTPHMATQLEQLSRGIERDFRNPGYDLGGASVESIVNASIAVHICVSWVVRVTELLVYLELTSNAKSGPGIPGPSDISESDLREAAASGDVFAAYSLGNFYANHDPDQAEHWLRIAADDGYTPAAFQLGVHLNNRGDPDQAEYWLRLAAKDGFEPATDLLMEMPVTKDNSGLDYERPFQASDLEVLESLNAAQTAATYRQFERFYGYVQGLVANGELNEQDELRARLNLLQLEAEWRDSPDEPRTIIIRTTAAVLVEIVSRHLHLEDLQAVIGIERASHVVLAIKAVAAMNEAEDTEAIEQAAVAAEELSSSLQIVTGRSRRRKVATGAAWVSATTFAGLAGGAVGGKLVHYVGSAGSAVGQFLPGLTPGWGAIVGALMGMLSMFGTRYLSQRSSHSGRVNA